ncbi:hypothetical protein D9M71_239960 [compost metagenome]
MGKWSPRDRRGLIDVLERHLALGVRHINEVLGFQIERTGAGKIGCCGEADEQPLHSGIAQRTDVREGEQGTVRVAPHGDDV